jgi:hypothetical protein
MPQAVVRPSLAIADKRTKQRPVSDAARGFRVDAMWSRLARTIEGDSNCGKSRTAAGVNRRKCAGCDACALRTSAASGRPTAAAAGPSCALSRIGAHGTAPGSRIQSDARRLGPRKCGLSGAITAPNDRFHVITQLNARDGPAKGRTSVLIDEERVF